jgi:hypothetical protein
LKEVFAQFNAINDIRNSLVHHGSEGEAIFERSDERKTTNRLRAHADRSIKEYRITTNLLRMLTDDLVKISQHLFLQDALGGRVTLAERAEEVPILGYTWRYKRGGQ